ncbi:hypothetical protein MNBD_ACTINO01-832 [hydrothermal vent metagenome]|uniref:Pilus assembly protein n=1 Tax=hydrothermal vent metagenome TaxID=652676 RepID=A0A3B0SJW7_9ZZZZ
MGVFFVLIMLVVQLGFLVIARSAVSASLDGVARRSVIPGAYVPGERERLQSEIEAVAPGLEVLTSSVTSRSERVHVRVTVEWLPPGPHLVPIRFTMTRTRALVVPP